MSKKSIKKKVQTKEITFEFELIYQLSRIADALENFELTTYEPTGEVEDIENGDGEEVEANEFEEASQG